MTLMNHKILSNIQPRVLSDLLYRFEYGIQEGQQRDLNYQQKNIEIERMV